MAEQTEASTSFAGRFSDAKKKAAEHKWTSFGLVWGAAFLIMDAVKKELTVPGMFCVCIAVICFLVDAVTSATSATEKIATDIGSIEAAVRDNTRVLRAHEELLASRTTDNLTLIAFENLLAYLPFYLAQDLGYLQDEHISITNFTASLDDQNTAVRLQENSRNTIAICDPYMCLSNKGIRLVYPICAGIAAWPMTLNWIGSAGKAKKHVTIAAYKAPSTTHVLAQLVARRVVTPRLNKHAGITATVVELEDHEANFGEGDNSKDILRHLSNLLMRYDVLMLWEPHCELALSLGARYLFKSEYETALRGFGADPLYSGLLVSQDLILENPTLPIRLRRALDRAVSRLQDPNRLSYCQATLTRKRLLNDLEPQVCEAVLDRLVRSVPPPEDPRKIVVPGINATSWAWATGMFAADRLRRTLVNDDPNLAEKFLVGSRKFGDAGEFSEFLYSPVGHGE